MLKGPSITAVCKYLGVGGLWTVCAPTTTVAAGPRRRALLPRLVSACPCATHGPGRADRYVLMRLSLLMGGFWRFTSTA
jgi:hypothetical protein